MIKEDALDSLESLFEKHKLITDPVELITYEVDAGLSRGTPDGVVFPESLDDVVSLVKWANDYHVPIVARSSGTGLSGGAVPLRSGVVAVFSRMNQIRKINETNRFAVAEPGVINLTLDTKIRNLGYYFPPDPASQRAAAIGGNLAENAGGPHCFKYGVTTNYVKGLEFVLADGYVVRTGGPASGYPEYDFTGIICGSEGTLAIITSAILSFIRNPTGVKTMIATFDSVEEAGQAVSAIIARGLIPATLEMMDRNIIQIIEDFAHAGLPTDAEALLLAEVDGYPDCLDAQIEEIREVLETHKGQHLYICQNAEEREQIWFARKSAFGAMARISPAFFQVDGTVPRSRLAETLSDINQICLDLELRVGYVFHAGDGNLHPLIPFDPEDDGMVQRVHQAGDQIMTVCVSKNGTISGEHGIGIEKRKYMPLMYTDDELTAMLDIKDIFDPEDILNPGKIFPEDFRPNKLSIDDESEDHLPPSYIPQNEDQAADALRAAQILNQQIFIGEPAAHVLRPDRSSILKTDALRSIITLSPDDLYVEVESGMTLEELQTELMSADLWIPIASPREDKVTIGGVISSAINSPLQIRYGAIRDQVLGLSVILPDGRRMRFGRPVLKNVAGYDMPKLFVGAHGTLGLITKCILKLRALPRTRRSLIVPVEDLYTGIRLGKSLHRISLVASAILLVPGSRLNEFPHNPYYVVLTAEGYEQDVTSELQTAHSIAGGEESDVYHGTDIWRRALNKHASYLRVGIPQEVLEVFTQRHFETFGDSFTIDIGNGIAYFMPAPIKQITNLRDSALALGGYAVVHNLDKDFDVDPWGYNPDTLPLMRRLKSRWDPNGVLNPGVFLV